MWLWLNISGDGSSSPALEEWKKSQRVTETLVLSKRVGISVRAKRGLTKSTQSFYTNSVFFFKYIIVEASCHNEDETIETIEAAEALLNMDSPGSMLDEKRMSE